MPLSVHEELLNAFSFQPVTQFVANTLVMLAARAIEAGTRSWTSITINAARIEVRRAVFINIVSSNFSDKKKTIVVKQLPFQKY